MLPSPGLEQPSSGQSHNLLNRLMKYASVSGVREAFFKAMPLFINIITMAKHAI